MSDLKQRVEELKEYYEVAVDNIGEILSDPNRILFFEEKTQLNATLIEQDVTIRALAAENERLAERERKLVEALKTITVTPDKVSMIKTAKATLKELGVE